MQTNLVATESRLAVALGQEVGRGGDGTEGLKREQGNFGGMDIFIILIVVIVSYKVSKIIKL